MKATQQLRDEHEGVRIILNILGKICARLKEGEAFKEEHYGSILEFLAIFVDKCHHGKEEDLLFPALQAAGVPEDGPIAVMLREHAMGRAYVKAMSESFSAYMTGGKTSARDIIQNSQGYISLLEAHMEKEEAVLFTMADDLLSEVRQDELLEGFERIEVERIGLGKHEEFHALIKELSGIYLG